MDIDCWRRRSLSTGLICRTVSFASASYSHLPNLGWGVAPNISHLTESPVFSRRRRESLGAGAETGAGIGGSLLGAEAPFDGTVAGLKVG